MLIVSDHSQLHINVCGFASEHRTLSLAVSRHSQRRDISSRTTPRRLTAPLVVSDHSQLARAQSDRHMLPHEQRVGCESPLATSG